MTNPDPAAALPTGAPRNALIAGLISVALVLVFLFTSTGPTMLILAIVSGLAGVVFGVIAIRKRDFVGVAVTGLVLGAIAAIVSASTIAFALVFVGALG